MYDVEQANRTKNKVQLNLDLCESLIEKFCQAEQLSMQSVPKTLVKVQAIYGIFDEQKCIYIGRTRNLAQRLNGHKSASTYSASFAVKRTRKELNLYKTGESAQNMYRNDTRGFRTEFDKQRGLIGKMNFRFVEVHQDHIQQYIFEMYATKYFGLDEGGFETH